MHASSLLCAGLVFSLSTGALMAQKPGTPQDTVPVYRLYNPNTGEHFYTAQLGEKNFLVKSGWLYEGSGWQMASAGDPVYRVYNPNAKGGDHYYTRNRKEASYLVGLGWRWDNNGEPVFVSNGETDLYVAYNANAQSGAHNYTTSKNEQDYLIKIGWMHPEVAWKAVSPGIREGHPGNRTAKADENITGKGGAEASVPGSYRTIYSNKSFDYADLDHLEPTVAFSCDFSMNGNGKQDYETQFVIAGNGEASGQIGIELHYQAGNDALFKQGEINTTIINFPAGSGTQGEQYYSVTTVAPKIKDGQSVHLEVQYYEKGYMAAYVNDQLVGMYKTKLTTYNRYILHNLCNTSNSIRNLRVEKNGVDVTSQGAPGFDSTSYDNVQLINAAY